MKELRINKIKTPLEKKRATYLQFYKDGIYDGILNQKLDPNKNYSAYYKRGFHDGLEIREHIVKYGIDNIGADNEKSST